MILIEEVKYKEVPNNLAKIINYSAFGLNTPLDEQPPSTEEIVHGRQFIRPDGKEVWLGVSKQAQEVIGITYEAWENTQKDLEYIYKKIDDLRLNVATCTERAIRAEKSLYRIETSDWKTRLKWLFTGVKI